MSMISLQNLNRFREFGPVNYKFQLIASLRGKFMKSCTHSTFVAMGNCHVNSWMRSGAEGCMVWFQLRSTTVAH